MSSALRGLNSFLIDYSQNNSRQMNMLKESFPAEKLFAFINKPEAKTT